MGTYNLSSQEIEEIFEDLEFESHLEGDFTAETFIEGAKRYLEKLKNKGMSLPYAEGLRFKIVQNFNKRNGNPIFFIHDRKEKTCNGQFEEIVGRIIFNGKKFEVDNK